MPENFRIHLLGLGFKWDWIPKSLKQSRADKFYLFRKKDEENKDALKAEKEVIKILKKKDIPYELVEYKQKDIFGLLKSIKEVIEKEKKNFIYLNISSGQREVLTSFAISSTLFKSIAKGLKLYSMEEGDFDHLPSFEVKLPEKRLIEAMKFIAGNNNECRKKELLKHVFENNIIKVDKNTPCNKYMKLNRSIVDKLLHWKFIEIEGKGKGSVIKLNEDGQNIIKFL